MEVLLFIVLLVSLATITASLVCTLVVLYFVTMPLKKKTINPRVRRVKRVIVEAPDAVKPNDAYEDTEPIESFEPDFSKPIKVTVSKEAKKSHTVDDEELTPIETDDLAEEDEEELVKKGLK